MIKLKRVYEPVEDDDGWRVLVERLWPRGISKEKASLDEWMKEISPSPVLRKWYAHDVEKWMDFKQKYIEELSQKSELVEDLLRHSQQGTVTLIYSAHDEQHNSALVLKEYLEGFYR
ncbi:MAG TPA: DUF488 domain-containing protein [Anaerolineales bacterium]|nr:DUF488 domain-containing protein [Anaerolineales bacterium]